MTTTPFIPWPDDLELILASKSPRRAEINPTVNWRDL